MKSALISVYNKTGIVNYAKSLVSNGYRILSTGGTYNTLKAHLPSHCLNKVEDITKFPEILNGRVKTLHPIIFGSILNDNEDLPKDIQLVDLDLVVVNLYPFSENRTNENIDIGGHAMIRASIKNRDRIKVITDPGDYFSDLSNEQLAKKAMEYITEYDNQINNWFNKESIDLKYGLNPSQKPSYVLQETNGPLKVLCGDPGYINVLDALLGWQLVKMAGKELNKPVFASYKHNSPAGVAVSRDITQKESHLMKLKEIPRSGIAKAFLRARYCDPKSSFGDFLASNSVIDLETANLIKKEVSDGLIAPGYSKEALEVLRNKKSGKFVILQMDPEYEPENSKDSKELEGLEVKEIYGIKVYQKRNNTSISREFFENYNEESIEDLILGNIALLFTTSNSVAVVKEGKVIGIGAGQQNRVDCVKLSIKKAMNNLRITNLAMGNEKVGEKRIDFINRLTDLSEKESNNSVNNLTNCCLVSDAFFPFIDSLEHCIKVGITTVSQPKGAVRESEINQYAKKNGIDICFTKERLFLH